MINLKKKKKSWAPFYSSTTTVFVTLRCFVYGGLDSLTYKTSLSLYLHSCLPLPLSIVPYDLYLPVTFTCHKQYNALHYLPWELDLRTVVWFFVCVGWGEMAKREEIYPICLSLPTREKQPRPIFPGVEI